ncbi:MAG: YggS family pyridoxal phosphate-dependent enzyme [Prolixibacteraceae bacterium]|nr:YggS family pyridoxal phosphate-dependent enzyme [Prolixibacteraceae bacterium]MBN2650407.1 YggS family pyridoxal phosphate-dependent enzyme [Prolixibacteraceae bacterium]
METITKKLQRIQQNIPDYVSLVAVSKTKPNEAIIEAYEAGQRIFGENKVQELTQKYNDLPKDIEWHFIGHLQTNKVKYIAPFVSLVHTVDSIKLLKTIDKEAAKNKRIVSCLLQFFIADEESKFGLNMKEADTLLQSEEYRKLQHVRITGVMGMATFTSDEQKITREFQTLKRNFDELKKRYFSDNDSFKEISMGMSNDYLLAIAQGSTMIRIGSTIFGEREYH